MVAEMLSFGSKRGYIFRVASGPTLGSNCYFLITISSEVYLVNCRSNCFFFCIFATTSCVDGSGTKGCSYSYDILVSGTLVRWFYC